MHNYEGEYQGPISLATATTTSDNSVFAQLTQLVGPGERRADREGGRDHESLQPYFAIGLGAEAVNPLEMARAYAAFANGGRRVDGSLFGNAPRAVQTSPPRGAAVSTNERADRQAGAHRAQSALVTSLLQGVVTSGTGKAAALPDRPVAGKTGTTENYGDAWFVGYTPQLAVGRLGRVSEQS